MRRLVDTLRQDLAYALRGLRRSPGLAIAIVVTLGLGVGANAAVFTALDRVFLQPPSGVADPGGVRRLYAHAYSKDAPSWGPDGMIWPMVTSQDFRDLTNAVRGTARLEADYLYRRGKLEPSGEPLMTVFVTSGYFDLLGIRPALGRGFSPDENRPHVPAPVAVIADAFWRSHFAADSAVLGKTVRVDQATYTIVGVAPRGFEGIELGGADIWVPLSNMAGGEIETLRVLARINPGVGLKAFDQILTAQYRRTHEGDRWVEPRSTMFTAPLLEALGPDVAERGKIPGLSGRSLALLPRLAGVALVVLVIAIANVASLLLMRAVKRRREIAVRLALGVSRARLMAQLATESAILALGAGVGAIAMAWMTGGILRSQLGSIRWSESVVDRRVVIVTMAIAIVAGVVAGLAPALFALRTDVVSGLKASTGANDTGSRTRAGLLITQSALCMALLSCAGAFLQSLRRAQEFDRGFDPGRAFILSVPAYYTGAESDIEAVVARLRTLPGVEAAGRSQTGLSGATGIPALIGRSSADTLGVGPRGPSVEFVDAEFLRAAGLRLVEGRLLAASDKAPVTVVNESVARALWRGASPIGQCLYVRQPKSSPCRTVVGVVRDLRWNITEPATYRIYLPREQAWIAPSTALIPNYLVVRMKTETGTADAVRLRTAAVPLLSGGDADLTIYRASSLIDRETRPWQLAATLLLILGGLGLVAAAAGIYGLVGYDVSRRSRELGVRITLGATSGSILRLVIGGGLRVVLFGVVAGAVASLAAGRVMASLLFGTSPYDPVVLAVTCVVLVGATILASFIPGWRATRIDPAISLSSE